jgi:hypothetical protein
MKKLALFSVVCFFCSRLASAQLAFPLQETPVSFNSNVLARSQGLPTDFALFSPDTASQILFNPARAAMSSQRFVYASYLPATTTTAITNTYFFTATSDYYPTYSYTYNSYTDPIVQYPSGSTVSFVTLFGKPESKWLLQVTNSLSRYTTNTAITYQVPLDPPYFTSAQTLSGTASSETQSSLFAFKLNKIFTDATGGSSFGVYGIYQATVTASTSQTSSNMDSSFSNPASTFTGNSILHNEQRAYAAGLEFSSASSASDFIISVGFQKGTLNSQNNSASSYYSQSYSSNFESNNSASGSPTTFIGRLYLQHEASWITKMDNLFASLNVAYTTGDLDYGSSYQQEFSPSNTPLSIDFSKSEAAKDLKSLLSFGYVVRQKLSDIEFLIGLNPQISYREITGISDNQAISYYNYAANIVNKQKTTTVAATIPIAVNYAVTPSIALFGGLNYQYSYTSDKTDQTLTTQPFVSTNSYIIGSQSGSSSTTNTSLATSSVIYLGADLSHASGLNVQVFIQNNFASLSSWYVSLGYRF